MFKSHPLLALAVACVACGSSFTARDGSNGGSGGVGAAGSGSAGEAGETDAAGASSAGEGPIASAGSSAAGSSAAGSSVAGSSGRGGWGSGGWGSGNGGNWGGSECSALRQEYAAAVEKARACSKGSTDECSATSVAQPIGCGCPVLINAKSEYAATVEKAYRAVQDAHCDSDSGRDPCVDAICAPAVTASCAQPAMPPGSTFVCTAGIAIQN